MAETYVVNGAKVSCSMGTCVDFAGEIIAALDSQQKAEAIKEKIIYNDTY